MNATTTRDKLTALAQDLAADLRKENPYIIAGTLMAVIVVGLISAFSP